LDKKDVPQYIYIDEITHFNLAELKALDIFAQINGIKIITAGDTLQKGATIGSEFSNINDIFTWRSPAMTLSVRSSNIHKKNNTDLLQQSLRSIEKLMQDPNIGYNLEDTRI
jgi:hypothetical protein